MANRTWWLCVLSGALVWRLGFCGVGFAQDSAMFRGDAAHSGIYAGSGVPKLNRVKWKFKTGGEVVSSPAVVGGVVYVGSNDGRLYAIDEATGSLKWKLATGARVSSSPAVADGVVFFGSYDGNFYALDAATGKVMWKFKNGASVAMRRHICMELCRSGRRCRTLLMFIYRRLWCGRGRFISEAAMEMCMHWMRAAVR